jgi:hypothetical protein
MSNQLHARVAKWRNQLHGALDVSFGSVYLLFDLRRPQLNIFKTPLCQLLIASHIDGLP